jgi:hypothetical protein
MKDFNVAYSGSLFGALETYSIFFALIGPGLFLTKRRSPPEYGFVSKKAIFGGFQHAV